MADNDYREEEQAQPCRCRFSGNDLFKIAVVLVGGFLVYTDKVKFSDIWWLGFIFLW